MSIGQKLKDARKNAGLSQEQLAEKLCVSRQAITKWESDKGIPDVENLQNISKLFDVSIDSLLDDSEAFPSGIIKESINLEDYPKEGKFKSKYDAVVKAKYPDAHSIMPLVRKKKLSTVEKALDFLIQPGIYHVADSINDMSAYYLVEKAASNTWSMSLRILSKAESLPATSQAEDRRSETTTSPKHYMLTSLKRSRCYNTLK